MIILAWIGAIFGGMFLAAIVWELMPRILVLAGMIGFPLFIIWSIQVLVEAYK